MLTKQVLIPVDSKWQVNIEDAYIVHVKFWSYSYFVGIYVQFVTHIRCSAIRQSG